MLHTLDAEVMARDLQTRRPEHQVKNQEGVLSQETLFTLRMRIEKPQSFIAKLKFFIFT